MNGFAQGLSFEEIIKIILERRTEAANSHWYPMSDFENDSCNAHNDAVDAQVELLDELMKTLIEKQDAAKALATGEVETVAYKVIASSNDYQPKRVRGRKIVKDASRYTGS